MFVCVHVCTVCLFTALLYRYNEDESVPGIGSDEKGFGVRLPPMTTGLVCVCVCELVWHRGLQFPPLSWMPLSWTAGGGGIKGTGRGVKQRLNARSVRWCHAESY